MFRLFIVALKPASFLADFSVKCILYLCIFRDYLDTLKDLHLNGFCSYQRQCQSASNFSVVASLDNNSVISSYTAVRACPSNQNIIPCHKIPYLQCIFLCQGRGMVVLSR